MLMSQEDSVSLGGLAQDGWALLLLPILCHEAGPWPGHLLALIPCVESFPPSASQVISPVKPTIQNVLVLLHLSLAT